MTDTSRGTDEKSDSVARHKKLRGLLKIRLGAAIILGCIFATCLWLAWPLRLFSEPYSFVIEDRHGQLLGARIAADGQWRFPSLKAIPPKFAAAIITREDRRFMLHPGFDPLSLARALLQDIRAKNLVSGASTIPMQVVRLSRHNPPRTLLEKCREIVISVKLTLRLSKKSVLSLYASHAPFGGNVVGLEAAAWRYFGRAPQDLSWAESATLAALPNEPGLVHPGRQRMKLLEKRNALLAALRDRGIIDSPTYRLAVAEPLVPRVRPLPDLAPHLLDYAASLQSPKNRSLRVQTTIIADLQQRIAECVMSNYRVFSLNQIHNCAAVVLDVATAEALAYIGNVAADSAAHGNAVDCIRAPRSTGSVLKPLLYAAMLDAGELLPTTLIPDIPTNFGGYTPQNFNRQFEGAVPASMALARSLNVPAARMVQQHGVSRFCRQLQSLGMTTVKRPLDDYGISIILGGVEGTLWELTGIYASMARAVNNYRDQPLVKTVSGSFFPPVCITRKNGSAVKTLRSTDDPLSPAGCWAALGAMTELARPGLEGSWKDFSSSRTVAWKTGTSFGFRDGWAIGVTPRFAVGVWVGNASGEGRPGLIGIETAAPILFGIFNILPRDGRWFDAPEMDLAKVAICKQSGYLAGPYCQRIDTALVPAACARTGPCPYHQLAHLDKTGTWRVGSACENVGAMQHRPWFVLPPAIEAYYRPRHSDYRMLPPLRPDCAVSDGQTALGLIYPHGDGQIYIPREIDGTRGKAILKAAHREPKATIHWHLDDQYLGSTATLHEMAVAPPAGKHVLTLVDDRGNRIERTITIIDK